MPFHEERRAELRVAGKTRWWNEMLLRLILRTQPRSVAPATGGEGESFTLSAVSCLDSMAVGRWRWLISGVEAGRANSSSRSEARGARPSELALPLANFRCPCGTFRRAWLGNIVEPEGVLKFLTVRNFVLGDARGKEAPGHRRLERQRKGASGR